MLLIISPTLNLPRNPWYLWILKHIKKDDCSPGTLTLVIKINISPPMSKFYFITLHQQWQGGRSGTHRLFTMTPADRGHFCPVEGLISEHISQWKKKRAKNTFAKITTIWVNTRFQIWPQFLPTVINYMELALCNFVQWYWFICFWLSKRVNMVILCSYEYHLSKVKT